MLRSTGQWFGIRPEMRGAAQQIERGRAEEAQAAWCVWTACRAVGPQVEHRRMRVVISVTWARRGRESRRPTRRRGGSLDPRSVHAPSSAFDTAFIAVRQRALQRPDGGVIGCFESECDVTASNYNRDAEILVRRDGVTREDLHTGEDLDESGDRVDSWVSFTGRLVTIWTCW